MEQKNGPYTSDAGVHARLAAIVESSDDAIISKTFEGKIEFWNGGAERIFGYTSDEVVGKPITIIIPTDRLEEEPRILQVLRRGERVDHFETIRQHKDGRLINVSVTISPIRDETGNIIGISKVARDITRQKQLELEIRAARDSAESARETAENASRAKDRFLSVLSHELRTPLTPVLAAVSMIEATADVPPEIAEHLGMIRRNIETEARLVDDLLDLTRIVQDKIELHNEVVDLHAVLRNTLMMFSQQGQQKGLTVTMALLARQFHVWADTGRFQQALLNLVSNAIKFTPQHGSVTIRTRDDSGEILVEISDTGIGIEPDVQARLFRPFEQGEQTVTRQFGGLGLGLSITKSLIDMHQGSITVASEGRNKGSTFTVRMRTVAAAQSQPTVAPPGLSHSPANNARVLLVEDHSDTRLVLTRLLTSFGYTVKSAASVKEALDTAQQHSFDLLISDIGLPDGSGTDVMRYMAKNFKTTGIALSGFGQLEDLRSSRDAGFALHLTKPVNIQTLRAAISGVFQASA